MESDPDPIQSFNKLAKIQQFNHEEAEREKLHRNDPLETKLLHISVVLVVIAIAFLIFFKLCWDREKYWRRNQPDILGGSRRTSLSSGSHPTRVVGHPTAATTNDHGGTTTTVIPEYSHHQSHHNKYSSDDFREWVVCGKK